MTDAERAYAKAVELIAEAKKSAAGTLNLDQDSTRALSRIPPEISELIALKFLILNNTQVSDLSPLAGMTDMTRLFLNNTQVSDLSPLAGMTEMTTLWLNNTQVSDLRGVQGMRKLVDTPEFLGLRFEGSAAALLDDRIARIAAVEDHSERARQLFDLLDSGWEPVEGKASQNIEEALRGPILSDSLADIRETPKNFEAATLIDEAVREKDAAFFEILGTLTYASTRLGKTETANRIGREISKSFADYADIGAQEPLNARLLIYLAQGIRIVLKSPDLSDALDDFDKHGVSGFLAEHDRLIRDYYPNTQIRPEYEVLTDPARLSTELFPKLEAARDILAQADRDGLFAPSVSNTMEMLHRRAEGARKRFLTSEDAQEREAAGKELQRTATLVAAYLGRIQGRLSQWVARQVDHGKKNPGDATLKIAGLYEVAQQTIGALSPVFRFIWELLGNLALPF